MARFSDKNIHKAKRIIDRYPRARSAIIPLCHLAQEQDGYLTTEAMEQIAELVHATPAEVSGVASFYEMFKMHPVGRYVVGVCTNISCYLRGADELLTHCKKKLGVELGETTEDGLFTLEEAECLAACTEAPALQVNYRFFNGLSSDEFDQLVDDIRAGVHNGDIPAHGTLSRIEQVVDENNKYGVVSPEAAAADRSRTARLGAPQ